MSWTDLTDDVNDAMIATFGEATTYQQAPAAAFALTVVWSERTGEPTTAWARVADLVAAGVTTPVKGDLVTKGTHVYRVAEHPVYDGVGGVTLPLRLLREAA